LLERYIGRGTFGEVWQARHHVWDSERVAIKLPTEPEYVRFLQREGLVVHGLRHPNIVRVLGLDPYAEVPYLVMELVRGPSLKQIIDEQPKGCDLRVAMTILRGILTGIAAAHEANVIHRDLKPGNVLLDLNGKPVADIEIDDVKLGDFGLGVPNEDALRSMVMQSMSIERDHQSSAIAGTLVYMAPELREGEARPTPKSDLFAVGVILYELLTGERPAGAELPSTIRPNVPSALDELFRRLYARVDRRFDTAGTALAELDLVWPKGDAEPRTGGELIFDYEAVNAQGQLERGQMAAPDSATVMRELKAAGLSTMTVKVASRAKSAPARERVGVDTGRMTCPLCHAAVEPEDQFCTQCGGQLVDAVRRCQQCGGWPGPFDRYCIHCGAAVSAAKG
jgi:serine/threonine protein kinase